MEYSPSTTEYDGDGVELLKDLDRAGFAYVETTRRKYIPTIIARSIDGEHRIGIQKENGRYVLVNVDDSLDVFAERVAQRRANETEFKKTLMRPVMRQNLEQLTVSAIT